MQDELEGLERRVVEHLDMRLRLRLARGELSTVVWVTVMNAVSITAVIAALRL